MSLIGLIVVIAVTGLIVWAIVTLVPMPEKFKQVIYVVAVVVVVLYVLSAFGLLGEVGSLQVPRAR